MVEPDQDVVLLVVGPSEQAVEEGNFKKAEVVDGGIEQVGFPMVKTIFRAV